MSNFVRGASNLESMRTSITLADNQNNINHALELEKANPSKLAKFNSTVLLSNVKNYLAQQSDNHANKKTFYDFVTSVYTNVVMNYVNPNNGQINISVQQEINSMAYSQVLADLLDTISLETSDLTSQIFNIEKQLEDNSQDINKLEEQIPELHALYNRGTSVREQNIKKITAKIDKINKKRILSPADQENLEKLQKQKFKLKGELDIIKNPDVKYDEELVNATTAKRMLDNLNSKKERYKRFMADKRVLEKELSKLQVEIDYWQIVYNNKVGSIRDIRDKIKDLKCQKEDLEYKKDIDFGCDLNKRTSRHFAEFIKNPTHLEIVEVLNRELDKEQFRSITGLPKSKMQEIITENDQN